MDYEDFYQPFKLKEKSVKETLKRQQASFQSITRKAEKGDLKGIVKDIATMEAYISEQVALLQEMREMAGEFDLGAYMENGDYAKQMLLYCESMGVNVTEDHPLYEVFPFKVKIDEENQEININRSKLQCARPQYIAANLKQRIAKLMKTNFNASAFLEELASAYDMLAENKRKENAGSRNPDLFLRDIHRCMVPMQRFRREYDIQSFAFDLSRLFASDLEFTKDGRQFSFGTARTQQIRILDKNGKEGFVNQIRFFS
jgi:hypothetical protein